MSRVGSHHRRAITPVVALLVLIAPATRAQRPASEGFAVLATDSVAWQRVLAYVVSSLAPDLVAAGANVAAQPWTLRLPADEPQRALLERQLRTLFRARAPLPSDSVVRTLEFGPLVVVRDTAYVRVRFDLARHCRAPPARLVMATQTASSWRAILSCGPGASLGPLASCMAIVSVAREAFGDSSSYVSHEHWIMIVRFIPDANETIRACTALAADLRRPARAQMILIAV